MSEFSDLVTDVEKMIRQKTILMSDIEKLNDAIKSQRAEFDELVHKVDSIKAGIEAERALSIKNIEDSNRNQSRVINAELERLNEASKEHEGREKSIAAAESRQRQKENELRGLEVLLIEREKAVILAEANQKVKESELSVKNDDVLLKIGKLENHIVQLKLILQQDRDLKIELEKISQSIKRKGEELHIFEKSIFEKQEKFSEQESNNLKRANELDFIESELNKETKENKRIRDSLDERKKNLDDKERALDAEKIEMAMKVAKANVKNK